MKKIVMTMLALAFITTTAEARDWTCGRGAVGESWVITIEGAAQQPQKESSITRYLTANNFTVQSVIPAGGIFTFSIIGATNNVDFSRLNRLQKRQAIAKRNRALDAVAGVSGVTIECELWNHGNPAIGVRN
jgi:hypothetical protein